MWRNTVPSNYWWAETDNENTIHLIPPSGQANHRIISGLLLNKDKEGNIVVTVSGHQDNLTEISKSLQSSQYHAAMKKVDVYKHVLNISVTPNKLANLLKALTDFEPFEGLKLPQAQIAEYVGKFTGHPTSQSTPRKK